MLNTLFNPRSVAIIGASTKPLSIGNRVLKNLADFGFKGTVYPINPKADKVNGLPAYPSILDVPDHVDVVHMVIPAKFVPQAVADCGKKKVKNIIINSGGFTETGPVGAAIEKEFLAIAKEYGIRVLGPNCQGIINTDPDVRAYCNFTFTKPEPGHISIAALSGGVAELIHQGFAEMGIGTRIYASNGNACDITIPEIIQYLGDDPGTRVIVTYVEGLRDAQTFLRVASEVAEKKPILAMKAGRTREGAKAAASHTGGLAGEDIATDLIFKKAGVLSFRDEGELIQAAAAFASQPIPRGDKIGIITNTGGPAVIATDILASAGCHLAPLSRKTETLLKKSLYPEASVNNPVDVLATGTAAHYRVCMDAMMDDDQFDAVYINFVTPFFVDTDSIAREIVEVNRKQIKPIICNLMTDRKQWTETVKILREGGVPCFSLPGVAARAMTALVDYNRIRSKDPGKISIFNDVDLAGARKIVEKAKESGRNHLHSDEVYTILTAYRIQVAEWGIAGDIEEAVTTARRIGFPVVVKAEAESLVHKSDVGGVVVNLSDEAAVRKAAAEMHHRLNAHDLQFLIQKYMPGGVEVICGAKAENALGHVILFGMGGVYVETLKDVAFSLTPVSDREAREMVEGLRLSPLLKGVRGQKGVDLDKLSEIVQRLSLLVTDLPEIMELDLNPCLAFEEAVIAVDARIFL
jgi:acetate---CoA ligase (ADP-forming)